MTIKTLSDRLDKLTSAKPTIKLTGFVMRPDGYIWPMDAIQRGDFWIVPNDLDKTSVGTDGEPTA